MHYDIPGGEGFGKCIITLNVKERATIVVEEALDHPGNRWQFTLEPGDAWGMRGYARERCLHGVSVGFALSKPCEAGCRSCRISLNLRCGEHSTEEVARICQLWE